MSKVYDIGLQRYRGENVRVCGKNSVPLLAHVWLDLGTWTDRKIDVYMDRFFFLLRKHLGNGREIINYNLSKLHNDEQRFSRSKKIYGQLTVTAELFWRRQFLPEIVSVEFRIVCACFCNFFFT